MAIDTKTKRLSFLNLGMPWWSTLPVADGTVDAADRLHFLHLYSGIPAGVDAAQPLGLEFSIPISRQHYTIPDSRPEFSIPISRQHFTIPEED